MVDPRSEDPSEFFWLDIISRTFILDPKLGLPPHDLVRARYTIDLLGLNDRAALVAARKRAASYYIDRLERYVKVKETQNMGELLNAVPEPHLVDEALSFEYEQARIKQALKEEIESCDHPTVWQELIRQRGDLRKTNDFLNRAPEALAW